MESCPASVIRALNKLKIDLDSVKIANVAALRGQIASFKNTSFPGKGYSTYFMFL